LGNGPRGDEETATPRALKYMKLWSDDAEMQGERARQKGREYVMGKKGSRARAAAYIWNHMTNMPVARL
jgi:hypothetical protein